MKPDLGKTHDKVNWSYLEQMQLVISKLYDSLVGIVRINSKWRYNCFESNFRGIICFGILNRMNQVES